MFKAFGKDGWIDERLQFPEFKERKPTLPLGYLPVLSIDDETFTQTEAIVRWAANISGLYPCLLYTSPSPRDATLSRMPSSA